MAIPRTHLGLVCAMAADMNARAPRPPMRRWLSKQLVTFRPPMRLKLSVRLGRVFVVLGAAALATLLFAVSPVSRGAVQADCSASSPCPTPTPTPTLAFLTLDVTTGDSNTQIAVNGGAFLANEQMTLYWDSPGHVAGGANADGSGNFVTHVKPFPGDAPGVHRLCASVNPFPCANFTLAATASPTPQGSPSPSPDTSPSPSATPTTAASASPTPVAASLSGFDVISKPPFVFLPIIGALAILLAVGYWAFSVMRRPTPLNIPATAVVHRATRPDYSAGFAAPPAATASAGAAESAWPEAPPAAPHPVPQASTPEPPADAAPQQPPAAGPQTEPPPAGFAAEPPQAGSEPDAPAAGWAPPASGWDEPPLGGPGASDDPLDLPEPGED